MGSSRQYFYLLLLLLCSVAFFTISPPARRDTLRTNTHNSALAIPMQPFPEAPWRTPNTLETRTIASTPFARFELHKVRTENGVIVDDWMWTDERSHVNVLIHLRREDKYLLFHQRKYGLERPAFATLGGLFKKGESELECASRELAEETGLVTNEMISLGKYRVQVNRGGGYLYAFLARNCVPKEKSTSFGKKVHKELWTSSEEADTDYEKQEHRLLSHNELLQIILEGKIGEAQWAATAAIGLLMEQYRNGNNCSTIA